MHCFVLLIIFIQYQFVSFCSPHVPLSLQALLEKNPSTQTADGMYGLTYFVLKFFGFSIIALVKSNMKI